jgi:predicted O-methyltransferase YrrM
MRPLPHFALWALGVQPAETQTTHDERAALARHAAGRTRLVEIGVWHGVTTSVLRRAMAPDGVLWAIDPFPRGRFGFSYQRRIARSEVARVTNGTVRWVRTTGELAAQIYRSEGAPPTGLVFIDGDHSYEALAGDWSAWSSLVAKGGVVCLHDSRSTPERQIDDAGSVIATERIVKRDPAFEVVEEVDSLTVVRRR